MYELLVGLSYVVQGLGWIGIVCGFWLLVRLA